jgi:ABC-type transport system involved in multi-copper enzyme maturation permease subunit
MNVWPVVKREARESSRRPATHIARVVVLAVVGSVAVALGFGEALEFGPGRGGALFSALHGTVFLATWVLVPFMTADCLSRERREGTLGLLFLTPLRAMDIVLAKLFVQALRGLTLWLAVVPLFALPLLMGGLAWHKAVAAVFHDFSALVLALAAGLAASSTTKQWRTAVVRAGVLGLLFALGYVYCVGLGAGVVAPMLPGMRFGPGFTVEWSWDWFSRDEWLRVGWQIIMGDPMVIRSFGLFGLQRLPLGIPVPLVGAVIIAGLSVLMVWVACRMASGTIRRNWQEQPPSPMRQAVERRFTTPVVGRRFLKRWLRRSLERNPVGWLEQRSWSGRLVTFGWLAVVTGVLAGVAGEFEFWMRTTHRYGVDWIQVLVAIPLLLSMAATSAGSFRRERQNGVLELLLVSPFKEAQLVWGRLRGLYAQFLPSIALLVAGWSFLLMVGRDATLDRLEPVMRFLAWAAAVPCIGLYCSLRFANFLVSFLMGVLLAWGVPWVIGIAWSWFIFVVDPAVSRPLRMTDTQGLRMGVCLVLAGLCVWQLIRQMEQRRFDFQREVS